MRDGWSRIRTRVDRLTAAVGSRTCDGQHVRTTVSDVQAGRPRARLAAGGRANPLPLRRRARVPPPRDAAPAGVIDAESQ